MKTLNPCIKWDGNSEDPHQLGFFLEPLRGASLELFIYLNLSDGSVADSKIIRDLKLSKNDLKKLYESLELARFVECPEGRTGEKVITHRGEQVYGLFARYNLASCPTCNQQILARSDEKELCEILTAHRNYVRKRTRQREK